MGLKNLQLSRVSTSISLRSTTVCVAPSQTWPVSKFVYFETLYPLKMQHNNKTTNDFRAVLIMVFTVIAYILINFS